MSLYIVALLLGIAAGFVQGVTGFGGGIVTMCVLPYFLPVVQSASYSTFTMIVTNIVILVQQRKHARLKLVLVPFAAYVVALYLSLRFAIGLDTRWLKLVFGLFLIAAAIYFVFFQKRARITANVLTALACGFLSGCIDGMFSTGGPVIVLYFLAICRTREEYLGTLQAYFLLASCLSIAMRIFAGVLTFDLMQLGVFGIGGLAVGLLLAARFSKHVSDEAIRKATYAFIALSGVINAVTAVGALL